MLKENNYNDYLVKLPHAFLTPLFAVVIYVAVVLVSRITIPARYHTEVVFVCVMLLAIPVPFFMMHISLESHDPTLAMAIAELLAMLALILWFSTLTYTLGVSADLPEHKSLCQYSLKEYFPSEMIGTSVVVIIPSMGGILAHHGLFVAGTALDKAFGWFIAHCSVLFVFVACLFSTLIQMSKDKGNVAHRTWTKKDIFVTFLPSMIRNSLLQVFVHPGCILTCMVFLKTSSLYECFVMYFICFVHSFRIFPSFEWVQCLNETPGKYTVTMFLDWRIPELAIPNQYTWLLAFASTLIGCTARSFIFGENFFMALFSLESLHAFIICRFLGTRIHAKASVDQYANPSPLWQLVNGRFVFPRNSLQPRDSVAVEQEQTA